MPHFILWAQQKLVWKWKGADMEWMGSRALAGVRTYGSSSTLLIIISRNPWLGTGEEEVGEGNENQSTYKG